MQIIKTKINGPLIIVPSIFKDTRGFFLEKYNYKSFFKIGIKHNFVQDNLSYSKKNVLRGLHFQKKFPQGKLVKVVKGEIFDVIVDLRKNKKSFGKYLSFRLSDKNHNQLWVPPGFAHGFCVLSKEAKVEYKCTEFYKPKDEYTLKWNDSVLEINWPIKKPIVSKKDSLGLTLEEIKI
jgi:dTDP-4-dehydrorhamnose 3,5-epimerase